MTENNIKQQFSVSVVIPAYNVEKYIARAIDSVIAQRRTADEIIVVDDGSTDQTADIIKRYGSKVRYIHQKNAGPSAARNTGIIATRYNWIAFLDADDQWLPDKLSWQIELLKRNQDIVWATGNYYMQNAGSNNKHPVLPLVDDENILKEGDVFNNCFDAINAGSDLIPSAMMVKRDILEQVGMFQEGLNYGEELDLWWRIGYRQPRLGYIRKPIAIYSSGREGSLTTETPRREIMHTISDLFEKHLNLAEQSGQREQLIPFIVHKLKKWTYALYCHKQFDIVHETTARFARVLPVRYTTVMRSLTRLPTATKPFGMRILKLLHYDR